MKRSFEVRASEINPRKLKKFTMHKCTLITEEIDQDPDAEKAFREFLDEVGEEVDGNGVEFFFTSPYDLDELLQEYSWHARITDNLPRIFTDHIFDSQDYSGMLDTVLDYQLSKAAPFEIQRFRSENTKFRVFMSENHRVFVENIALKLLLHRCRKEHFHKLQEKEPEFGCRGSNFSSVRYHMKRCIERSGVIKKLNDQGFPGFPDPWCCTLLNYNYYYETDCYARMGLGANPDFVRRTLVDIDADFETIAHQVLEYVGDLHCSFVGWHIMPGYIRCRDLRSGEAVSSRKFFKQIVQNGYPGTEKELCDAVQKAIIKVFALTDSSTSARREMKKAHKHMAKSFKTLSLYEQCNLTKEKEKELDAAIDPWASPPPSSDEEFESEEERD